MSFKCHCDRCDRVIEGPYYLLHRSVVHSGKPGKLPESICDHYLCADCNHAFKVFLGNEHEGT